MVVVQAKERGCPREPVGWRFPDFPEAQGQARGPTLHTSLL